MAEDWKIPAELQPDPADYGFDLDTALSAVVGLRATVPPDAFTASVLGTEREGSGVVIGEDGLLLTMGYLELCLNLGDAVIRRRSVLARW